MRLVRIVAQTCLVVGSRQTSCQVTISRRAKKKLQFIKLISLAAHESMAGIHSVIYEHKIFQENEIVFVF
jgi:hypothetical protein